MRTDRRMGAETTLPRALGFSHPKTVIDETLRLPFSANTCLGITAESTAS